MNTDDMDNHELLDDDENIDEDQVIDVAEKIFIRIAEKIIEQDRPSLQEIFKDHLFETEI